jgi:hypothetical protein
MSLKKLHREMMLSAVYQLSSADDAANFEKDAGNRFYWRNNRRRMDAEQLRDALLFVSGALDTKSGGPSEDLKPVYTRRTLYGKVSRYRLDEYLQLFDFPSPNLSAEKRFTTNVPLQRLFLMNSDFAQQQSELLARRVEGEADVPTSIRKAYRLVYGRTPSDAEVEAGAAFLRAEPLASYEERKADKEKEKDKDKDKTNPPTEPDAKAAAEQAKLLPVTPWGRYLKILLSNNEFLYID